MKLWLTYAWKDNEDDDVDYVVQELEKHGIEVVFDRVHLLAGGRLWDAIDKGISDPHTGGWAIYSTRNSLQSEPCLEELAYALDRALQARGGDFPIIGIFPVPMPRDLIPSALATRLYVTLNDSDWARRIADGLRGVRPKIEKNVAPVHSKIHRDAHGVVLEFRPRDKQWSPGVACVPAAEKSLVAHIFVGAPGSPRHLGIPCVRVISSDDGQYAGLSSEAQVTNHQSLFVRVTGLPSRILVGDYGNQYPFVFNDEGGIALET
ncbi:toll/interleukin-1 receptor domain-containing protein [Sinorhizobium meliloti]|uniref:toll/interleukin-1 receptor domain-containing protein n=1 Tax=Rhizobium meliloti TaxID=382 RepID=UPI002090915E|nr:toll/interleukin-1 receptor domain-containing protein [Sinorhizobium meliloti]MCO5962344.1 toll/interleukin-1 receptor domain-containing protein [Sinorhizobium meliloti]